MVLSARNTDVDTINDVVTDRLSGEVKTYLSVEMAFKDGGMPNPIMPQEYLNTVNLECYCTYSKSSCTLFFILSISIRESVLTFFYLEIG